MNTIQEFEAITPSETEALLAKETSRRLETLLDEQPTYRLQLEDHPDEILSIPASAMHLLAHILAEMAQGNAVSLTLVQSELSTQQAADILNVSRPYLVQLLESGEIPHRKVGTHRRVMLRDVMAYKQEMYTNRLQTLNELTAYDQELGLQ